MEHLRNLFNLSHKALIKGRWNLDGDWTNHPLAKVSLKSVGRRVKCHFMYEPPSPQSHRSIVWNFVSLLVCFSTHLSIYCYWTFHHCCSFDQQKIIKSGTGKHSKFKSVTELSLTEKEKTKSARESTWLCPNLFQNQQRSVVQRVGGTPRTRAAR